MIKWKLSHLRLRSGESFRAGESATAHPVISIDPDSPRWCPEFTCVYLPDSEGIRLKRVIPGHSVDYYEFNEEFVDDGDTEV